MGRQVGWLLNPGHCLHIQHHMVLSDLWAAQHLKLKSPVVRMCLRLCCTPAPPRPPRPWVAHGKVDAPDNESL